MTDDAKERERANTAAKLSAMVTSSNEEWPMHRELIAMRARVIFAQYGALVKQGFEPTQALDICWRY